MRITDLTKLKTPCKCLVKFEGKKLSPGVIIKENELYYIFQDVWVGYRPTRTESQQFGFKYSFCCYDGLITERLEYLEYNGPINIENYKDFQIGDVLENGDSDSKILVLDKKDDYLIVGSLDELPNNDFGFVFISTNDVLLEKGYKLVVEEPVEEPPIVEMTMEEVAKVVGIPVEQLKIKQ